MKNLVGTISAGLITGAVSWAVVSLVSDRYEPFDSDIGFYVGQFILSIIAVWVGYKKTFSDLAVYLLSAYLGMNAYAYIFGGSEQRAWAVLGLFTTVSLVVIPFVFGIVGKLASVMRRKYHKANSADARIPRG